MISCLECAYLVRRRLCRNKDCNHWCLWSDVVYYSIIKKLLCFHVWEDQVAVTQCLDDKAPTSLRDDRKGPSLVRQRESWEWLLILVRKGGTGESGDLTIGLMIGWSCDVRATECFCKVRQSEIRMIRILEVFLGERVRHLTDLKMYVLMDWSTSH